MLSPQQTINCGGRLLDLTSPVVMGIINISPDSFYKKSRFIGREAILKIAEKMLEDGAAILDVGGMSSRPGAKVIGKEEELSLVVPIIEILCKTFPAAIVSVDTVNAEVARQAAAIGAGMINDISAGSLDVKMYETVAALNLPYVLMHMQGRPETMQNKPEYEDVVLEVLDFFIAEIGKLRDLGLTDIILDPGFGFGKRIADNYELLKKMHVFGITDLPIMAGISRKSMIYKKLDISPEEALPATSALHMIALQQGARILRCHDVKEAVEVISLWKI